MNREAAKKDAIECARDHTWKYNVKITETKNSYSVRVFDCNTDTYFHYYFDPERVAPKKGRIVKVYSIDGCISLRFSKGFIVNGKLRTCQDYNKLDDDNDFTDFTKWEELPGQGESTINSFGTCCNCISDMISEYEEPCKSCETTIPTNFEEN